MHVTCPSGPPVSAANLMNAGFAGTVFQSPLFAGHEATIAALSQMSNWPAAAASTEFDNTPAAFSLSFFKRWCRKEAQKRIGEVKEQRLLAESLAQKGTPEAAAGAQIKLGRMLWFTGQSYGDGRWFEAEEAWVRGALSALHLDPQIPVTDEAAWKKVISFLTERRILKSNPRRGIIPGDDHVDSIELGLGGKAHVWKIFGFGAAVKEYDDGGMNYMSVEFAAPRSAIQRRLLLDNDVAGLREARNIGLGAAFVYHANEEFLVRQIVEGVTYAHITDALEMDMIPEAMAAAKLYREKLKGRGIDEHGFGGNAIWNRATRQWALIDA